MGVQVNESPAELTIDEEALYNMPMDELERMVTSRSLEQPQDEDSDSDVEETEDTDETEEEVEEPEDYPEDSDDEDDEDASEEADEDASEDEDEDEGEDQTETESTEEQGDGPKPQSKPATYKVKAVGTEIEFTIDELKELASKGLDYTKKMQEVAPWRKQIAAMKQHNVTQDDVNLLIDLKNGSKEAIMSLMKDNGIDPLDVDMEEVKSYTPRDYSVTDEQIQLRETVTRLAQDKEVYPRTEHVVDNAWDAKSRQQLLANPAMIEGLHNDIKNGVYDKLYPTMLKLKSLDGGMKSDLEYYWQAGQVVQQQTVQEGQQKVEKEEVQRRSQQEDIKENSQRRKVASLPKARAGKKKDIINYLDEIPDEDYKKWLKKVESKF